MVKVLLTGATGFLGRHIYRVLLAQHDVYPTCGRLIDLLDLRDIELLLQKTQPQYLIANAWMAIPKIFWDHPSNSAWAEATKHLIYRFYKLGGQRCIFVSSEAAVSHLDTPYGQCKKRVEDFLSDYRDSSVIRISYLRGEREAKEWAETIAAELPPALTFPIPAQFDDRDQA